MVIFALENITVAMGFVGEIAAKVSIFATAVAARAGFVGAVCGVGNDAIFGAIYPGGILAVDTSCVVPTSINID